MKNFEDRNSEPPIWSSNIGGLAGETAVENALTLFGAEFNRVVKDSKREIWKKRLGNYPAAIIHEAAAEIADKDEYFPSRSRMLRAIREKLPFQQHRFIETVDASGVKCFFDPQKNEFMYSAPNCPEGREFLELLKSLGAKQDQTLLRAKRKIQTREPGE